MKIKDTKVGESTTKNLVIGLMQAFSVPISISGAWFKNARDREAYRPFFQPWRLDHEFDQAWSKVSSASTSRVRTAYNIYTIAKNAAHLDGEIWECGVYRGATAHLIKLAIKGAKSKSRLRLFDTFAGMPEQTKGLDDIPVGDLANTSLQEVRDRVALVGTDNVEFHEGMLPDTFRGLENARIAFAHIDVDQYVSVLECCKFIYPRVIAGGFVLFDDYGKPGTPGARKAADEFLADKNESMLVLETGQSLFIKL